MIELPLNMIEVAKKAACEAGKILLNLRNKKHSYFSKKLVDDFATDADLTVEKQILQILQSRFPNQMYISEEIGKINGDSEYCWIIDPLDGTIPYTSGMPMFGVSIGLVKNNEPILGVINLPALKSLYWAERGKGAFLNGKKICVSNKNNLTKSVVGLDVGHIGGRKEELTSIALPLADKVRYIPMLACSVVGCAYVASGIYDAYVHSAYPWDFAAGVSIITEAGGKVSSVDGKQIDWSKDWINLVASNGLIQKKILSLIKK